MFHLDVTCEDVRLIATEHPENREDLTIEHQLLTVAIIDNCSGRIHRIPEATFCDVEKLVSGMICCHGDVPTESYPHLEELLAGCPLECRPIP